MQEFKKKKKKNGPGATTLIISNKEMNDIMKIVQAFEDCNILLKGDTKIIKKRNRRTRRKICMLLGILGARLLKNLLTGKGIVRAGSRNKKREGIVELRNFYATASFNKPWNTKALSK